ncbi:MAG: prepilin-type N-terminal cleavage/methylation domain-containing protein [Phycisphaerales bacterium]|nr:prepilin-type N-terminal cleavage/methylation domain-containing protein [Phycisphaerales bacterium]
MTSRPQVERRGLSLLELLLALGLVLVIAAIAAPLTFREFTRNETAAALERLAMQAVLARVEARQTGIPHELMVDGAGRRLTVQRVDPRDPGSIMQVDENLEFGDEFLRMDEEAMPVLAESWQFMQLPEGMRLEPLQEALALGLSEYDPEGIEEMAFTGVQGMEPDPFPGPVRLALFMPDGSLLGVRSLAVMHSEGRKRITLDPWTGRMAMEPIREEDFSEPAYPEQPE